MVGPLVESTVDLITTTVFGNPKQKRSSWKQYHHGVKLLGRVGSLQLSCGYCPSGLTLVCEVLDRSLQGHRLVDHGTLLLKGHEDNRVRLCGAWWALCRQPPLQQRHTCPEGRNFENYIIVSTIAVTSIIYVCLSFFYACLYLSI
jgi:hypothetical protein